MRPRVLSIRVFVATLGLALALASGCRCGGAGDEPAKTPAESRAPEAGPPARPPFAEPGVEVSDLSNGMRVVIEPMSLPRVAVALLFDFGWADEPADQRGLVEVMTRYFLQAGTATAPVRTAAQLDERYHKRWLTRTGAGHTGVVIEFLSPALVEELADLAARLAKLQINAEVFAEVTARLDSYPGGDAAVPRSARLAARLAAERVVAAIDPGAWQRGVDWPGNLDLPRATRWSDQHVAPRNATLVIVGGVDPAVARQAVEVAFVPLPAGAPRPAALRAAAPSAGGASAAVVEVPELRDAGHLCLALRAPAPTDSGYAAILAAAGRIMRSAWELGAPGGPFPAVQFNPVDGPGFVQVCNARREGEPADQAVARLDRFVGKVLAGELERADMEFVENALAKPLGMIELPLAIAARELSELAFELGRRAQLGVAGSALRDAVRAVTPEEFRAAAKALAAPGARIAAVVTPG